MNSQTRHYIIKMHGDLDDLDNNFDNLVLKEQDYTDYSRTHEMIEMYIKSLLFDHTFLFIGYSFNDNNLKLIMGYIDYYIKKYNIDRKNKHYLVLDKLPREERDYQYWSKKGIEIIDLSELNDTMEEISKCYSVKDIKVEGRPLYTFLKYLDDYKLPYSYNVSAMSEFLTKKIENYMVNLNIFKQINSNMLIEILRSCGLSVQLEGQILRCEYKYLNVLKYIPKKSKIVKKYFDESQILQIGELSKCVIYNMNMPSIKKIKTGNNLFNLYLKNRYSELIDEVNKIPDIDPWVKAYYYFIIRKYSDCEEMVNKLKSKSESYDFHNLSHNNLLNLSLMELNRNLLAERYWTPSRESTDYTYLDKIICYASTRNPAFIYMRNFYKLNKNTGNEEIINELNRYLLKQEICCVKNTFGKYGPVSEYHFLPCLRTITYNYYFFFKTHHIMIDYSDDISDVFVPYIRAIFCLYHPVALTNKNLKCYKLNIFDIDMIVKYIDYENFTILLGRYKVSRLEIENDVTISEIFSNFCTSMIKFDLWESDYNLVTFVRLICLIKLSKNQIEYMYDSMILFFNSKNISHVNAVIFGAFYTFVKKYFEYIGNTRKSKLLEILISDYITKKIMFFVDTNNEWAYTSYSKLIKKLSSYANIDIYKLCFNIITLCRGEKCKTWLFHAFYNILSKYAKNEWHNLLDINSVCEIINAHLDGLIEKLEDIDFLKKCEQKCDYIDFLFNPESFDYSKIKINDYMWCRLIKSEQYREKILEHKSEFCTEENKNIVKNGLCDEYCREVAYKYLFDDE